jgi:hypothetical protein
LFEYDLGNHTLTVTATDNAGNIATVNVSFTVVDDVPPEISITEPTPRDYSYTEDITLDFSATDEKSGIASITAELDGTPVTDGQIIDLFEYDLGNHTLTVTATDNAGNIAGASVTFRVIDDVPPIVTITSPADGARVNLTVTINATATDEKSSPTEIISVLINGEEVATTVPYDWDTTQYVGGQYNIAVKARDQADNIGSDSIDVTVDSPLWLKSGTIAKLEAAKTGDKKIDKETDRIIKHIQNSLKGSLWIDDWHLAVKHGKKIFHEEHTAVKHIQKETKKKSTPDEVKTIYVEVISDLVKADELLAKVAIKDAKNTPISDPHKGKIVNHEIEMAEKELAKAYEELEKDRPDKAIKKFEKAWEHAQHAIKHAQKEAKARGSNKTPPWKLL